MASDEEVGVVDLDVATRAEVGGVGSAVDGGFGVAELAISLWFRHFCRNLEF